MAGSDSGGGAGIQADLKTMQRFGVYGLSVVTAVTAQNTLGVQDIRVMDADFVRRQLASVMEDIGADAVKIGMLGNESIVLTVAQGLRTYDARPIVVDPVMVAKGGEPLLSRGAVVALKESLFPIGTIITPNVPEAQALCGYSLDGWNACRRAMEDMALMGPRAVILKGGHMSAQTRPDFPWASRVKQPVAVDLLFHDGQITFLVAPRIESRKTHGTGCTFSAALASMLARGTSLPDAVAGAKSYVYRAIEGARDWDVGNGQGPIDHAASHAAPCGLEEGGAYWLEGRTWRELCFD